ncbi:MarR family transcriptional regulator [Mycolicibacterium septicum DSM 44393]|uniref:MarR family transcriptional regulator n=1 Tax=Mycolicibacterium septicum DSM 44393 TaxID=1341646 RepID=A0A7X6RZI9_9MYCO|nr:MarR family transcriptional regulator [Mycobacteriaceae bacterium Msp059]NKZ15713.1 MarR family transcriptional regulator [Mycolicibacterium septicum DSM 44393]
MSSHLSQPPGGYSSCFADSRIEGASGRSGIGPSTIASRTGIAPTTVAAILTRLERDGRIDRRPNPEDARSSLLAIADDTGRELTRLYEGLNNEFARTITALTTPERTTITGFLQDLSTTIHRFGHFGPVRQGSARSEAGEGDSASRA